MTDILGIPPGLEGQHETVTKDYLRKTAFRRLLSTVLAETLPSPTTSLYHIVNLGCRRGDDTDDIPACFHEAKKHTNMWRLIVMVTQSNMLLQHIQTKILLTPVQMLQILKSFSSIQPKLI